MNIRPDQLPAAVTNNVYPVYMVSGDEPLQQMEALDCIRHFLHEQAYTERDVLDVDNNFDWQRLLDEAASMSLFASRRIVELRLPSAKPGRQGSTILKDYLANPPEDTVLLINAGKLDAGSKKSAWYKAIDKKGMLVQCWPIPAEKLPQWLRQRFRIREMEADDEVLGYISQHVEGNLLAAEQEIEKLSLLLKPGKVSYDDVSKAITSQSRYNVFELSDMLLRGNNQAVIKILGGLKAEGVVPVVVNWALTKDIRLLAQVAGGQSDNRSSPEFLLKRSGVWHSRLPLFKNCLSRHKPQMFQHLLKRCAYIDAVSKGMVDANVWDEIEILSMKLASHSR